MGEGSPTRNVFCKNCDQKINHIQFPLIVCEHGHIYDFPFFNYTHKSTKYNPNIKHIVKFIKNGSSILNGTLVCSCGASHSLSGVTGQSKQGNETPFQREMNHVNCDGKRSWRQKDYR